MPFTKSLLTSLALMSTTGWARYVLEQDYMAGGNFFEQFTFWNSTDPTNGFVQYQAEQGANDLGLISSSASNVRMGVDHTNVVSAGRPSVRITSNKSYQSGLFIIDLDHMPGGICGTWPAFWLVGPDWPNQGEIDIIEGVNDAQTNSFTLHTGPGCTIGASSGADAYSGSLSTSNCDVNAAGQANNVGCGIRTTDTATYGTQFNNNQGGVFATEWTDNEIAIYFFPHGSIPSDITGGNPNPSSWGEPMALFAGGCNFGEKFTNNQIVFDTTFCGDWAGDAWGSSTCASKASTCEAYVGNTPGAFKDAYWSVNSLKVYQKKGGSGAPPQSTGWGGQSSFATQTTAWPNPLSSPAGTAAPTSEVPNPLSSPAGSPAPSHPAFSNPLSVPAGPQPTGHGHGHGHGISEVSGRPQWPASQTAANDWPQQSGSWGEESNGDGSWSVGRPVGNGKRESEVDVKRDAEVDVKRIHSRHLARHRRRHGGGLV